MGFSRKRIGKGRAGPVHGDVRRPARLDPVCWDLRQREGRRPGLAEKPRLSCSRGGLETRPAGARRSGSTSRTGGCPTMYWSRPPGRSTPITWVPLSSRRWARCGWGTSSPSTSANGFPGCSAKAGQRGPSSTAKARSSAPSSPLR